MNDILNTLCEENWLITADHIVTILFGIASFILAIFVFILSKRDKQKALAINELQNQTTQLKELYLSQIQPRFTVKDFVSGWIKVVNIGNDAYNVNVTSVKPIQEELKRFFNAFNDFYSSGNEEKFNYSAFKEHELLFQFEDKLGNKYEQMLYVNNRKFSNLKEV